MMRLWLVVIGLLLATRAQAGDASSLWLGADAGIGVMQAYAGGTDPAGELELTAMKPIAEDGAAVRFGGRGSYGSGMNQLTWDGPDDLRFTQQAATHRVNADLLFGLDVPVPLSGSIRPTFGIAVTGGRGWLFAHDLSGQPGQLNNGRGSAAVWRTGVEGTIGVQWHATNRVRPWLDLGYRAQHGSSVQLDAASNARFEPEYLSGVALNIGMFWKL